MYSLIFFVVIIIYGTHVSIDISIKSISIIVHEIVLFGACPISCEAGFSRHTRGNASAQRVPVDLR